MRFVVVCIAFMADRLDFLHQYASEIKSGNLREEGSAITARDRSTRNSMTLSSNGRHGWTLARRFVSPTITCTRDRTSFRSGCEGVTASTYLCVLQTTEHPEIPSGPSAWAVIPTFHNTNILRENRMTRITHRQN